MNRHHGGAAAVFTSCFLFAVLKLLGSLSDPVNISGLAHFCEHMLFLGTKKYPKENEYSQFLSEHAGSSNAFTSGEHTNYYFDISHEHLQGALDRSGVSLSYVLLEFKLFKPRGSIRTLEFIIGCVDIETKASFWARCV